MIFIIFFALIVAIVVGLNMIDNSNINKIEEFLKSKECTKIEYAQGYYQALCKDKIIIVKNSFSVDVNKDNKIIEYKDIKDIKRVKSSIILTTLNDNINLIFKNNKNIEIFYKELQDK